MKRRLGTALLIFCTGLTLYGCNKAEETRPAAVETTPLVMSLPSLWPIYQQRFIVGGRVHDVDNGGQTHSEAQAYGLLLAEAANDRETFHRIWEWTQIHLLRRDGLFAWRYASCPDEVDMDALARVLAHAPDPSAPDCVTDSNNASDGEILIAWALLRAAQRWGLPALQQSARKIAEAVVDRLIVEHGGQRVLLPGLDGFEQVDANDHKVVIINPSYWVFPAFDLLAEHFPDHGWQALGESGRALLRQVRFGTPGLPPDWLVVAADGGLALPGAYGFEPVYGFNAVRVPLHLVWGRPRLEQGLLAGYLAWWAQYPDEAIPAWVDLQSGNVASFPLSAGGLSVVTLTRAVAAGSASLTQGWTAPGDDDGYFSWSLALLALVAAQETVR